MRSHTALRDLYVLAHAVFYFVRHALGRKPRLNLLFKRVCEKAKRFYEVASFYQYAVADGIHRRLFARPVLPAQQPRPTKSRQLLLAFARATRLERNV